ncbi:MAG: hypothetical protein Q9169_002252 [Polycauliona sp. 2 TL-2023]
MIANECQIPMSKRAVNFSEKELPPIPRSYQTSQRSVPDLPEVYYREGLCPRAVSLAIPQVQTGDGIERTYEPLEASPNGSDPPTIVVNYEESMSLSKKSKRRRGLAFLAIGIIVALAVGLGAGLGLRKRSIYQIMTDRFSGSNPTSPCDVTERHYCGGTWQGIIDRLDYIQNMGFTAVWISPITVQMDEKTAEGEAYHGYWQQNIFAVNPHFGTISDLQALATALHARNMYLMVDVVVNHFGWAGNGDSFDYSKMYPFNDLDCYHPYCKVTNQDYPSNQTAVELCWLGDDVVSLPDYNTASSFVRKMYDDWIRSLVSVFGIDGLRIDTVRHMEKSFWPGFRSAAGVYTLGEVLNGDMAYTCPYQEQLDGLMNYPLYYPLTSAFQETNGNMTYLGVVLSAIQDSCQDSTLLATFSENHDLPRFLNKRNDMTAQMNVIVFTILAGGIPIIYQGQEQGFSGGEDPANREALWDSGYSTESPLYKLIAYVNQIRNREVFASPDYLTTPTSVIYTDDHHIALQKGNLVSLYSNEGSNGTSSNVTLTDTGFQENQAILEILMDNHKSFAQVRH